LKARFFKSINLFSALTFLLVLLLPTQLGFHFWSSFSFVAGLRIDYYSPTIYLTDILLTLVLFIKVQPCNAPGLNLFKSFKSFFKSIIHYPSATFFFLFSLYSIKLPHPWLHLYGLARALEVFLLFWIIKNLKNLKPVFWGLVGAVSYTTILATAQFLSQRAISGKWYFLGERWFTSETPGIAQTQIFGKLLLRPYATFSHPNSMAGFLLISLWLIFYLAKSFGLHKKTSLLPAACCLLPAASLGILLSFSHTAWLVFLISILIYIFKPLRIMYYVLRITLFISLTFPIILLTTAHFFPLLAQHEEIYLRNFLAQKGIEAFLQKPFLGQGINHFIHFLGSYRPGLLSRTFYQPIHNIWWLILAETGLVGLVFALWLTLKTIKKICLPSRRRHSLWRRTADVGRTPVVKQAGGVLKSQITNHYHNSLLLSLISIFLLAATDHYLLTLQQNRLLLGLFLGLVWRKTK